MKGKQDILHLCVIGAHIGDADIMAGGVACKYARRGHQVTLLHLSAGEKGNPAVPPESYREQKIEEAEESARIMGAACVVLEHKDGELPNTDEAKRQLGDLLRELRPQIIVTHWKGSFHKDHRACHELVMEATFYAALPGIKLSHPPHLARLLYYAENWEDPYEYQPDLWMDISEVYEQWLEALRCHALFRGEVAPFDYLRYYQGLVAMRGAEVGVKQAETFMIPGISRKRRLDSFPLDEPVLVF